MTRKEKIIKILNQYIVTENNTCYCNSDAEGIADEILALPLDVPNSDEILSLAKKKGYYGNVPDAEINAFLKGALAVIIEIIKRNK
jgi:hypothetical protein